MNKFTVTIVLRPGTDQMIYHNIIQIDLHDNLLGLYAENEEGWVYPIDVIQYYHIKKDVK